MDELSGAIMSMPMGNLFLVGGLIFLAIAVLGKISGKIAPSKNGRIASAVLGCIFLALGLFIQFRARPSALPQPVSPLPDQTVTAATQVPAGSEPTTKPITATPSRAQPTAIPPTPTPTLAPTATPAPAARAPDPALIEVLTGEDAPEKAMAAMRIGATSYSEGVVQALIECLDDFTRLIPSDKIPMIPPGPLSTDPNETTASEQCVNALVRIGEPAVEPLIAALAGDYGFWHLEHIAEALGLIGDARALPPLLELLNQGRVELISIAVGRLGGEEAYTRPCSRPIRRTTTCRITLASSGPWATPKTSASCLSCWSWRREMTAISNSMASSPWAISGIPALSPGSPSC